MAYCTKTDLLEIIDEDILTQLTDEEGTGIIDDSKITKAIEKADAKINSYCGAYKLPFDPAPLVIKGLSEDLAIYYLYRIKIVPEDIVKTYDDAIKALKDIQKGIAGLGVQPIPDAPAEGGYSGSIQVNTRTKVFDSDTMDMY